MAACAIMRPMPDPSNAPAPAVEDRALLCKGARFDFERLWLRTPDGKRIPKEIVRHPGAVVIAPVLPDGRIVLIRNFRPAVESWMWELPAGTLDPAEAPAVCARRELLEETGYRAANILPLAQFRTTPGLTDELMRAFVATGLELQRQALEEGELIEVAPVSPVEALRMIDSGDIQDGKTIVTLLLAHRRGLLIP